MQEDLYFFNNILLLMIHLLASPLIVGANVRFSTNCSYSICSDLRGWWYGGLIHFQPFIDYAEQVGELTFLSDHKSLFNVQYRMWCIQNILIILYFLYAHDNKQDNIIWLYCVFLIPHNNIIYYISCLTDIITLKKQLHIFFIN